MRNIKFLVVAAFIISPFFAVSALADEVPSDQDIDAAFSFPGPFPFGNPLNPAILWLKQEGKNSLDRDKNGLILNSMLTQDFNITCTKDQVKLSAVVSGNSFTVNVDRTPAYFGENKVTISDSKGTLKNEDLPILLAKNISKAFQKCQTSADASAFTSRLKKNVSDVLVDGKKTNSDILNVLLQQDFKVTCDSSVVKITARMPKGAVVTVTYTKKTNVVRMEDDKGILKVHELSSSVETSIRRGFVNCKSPADAAKTANTLRSSVQDILNNDGAAADSNVTQ